VLEFAGDQAVLRVDGIELSLRAAGLIARLLQRQVQRVALGLVIAERGLHRLQGRLKTSGLDRVKDLVGHGLVHPQTPDGETGGGAAIDAPSVAGVAGHLPAIAAIRHMQQAATASTP